MPSIQAVMTMQSSPAIGAIDKVVGALKKLTNTIGFTGTALLGVGAAAAWFGQKALRKAAQEAIGFQREMAELTKLLGPEFARPVAEAIGDLSEQMPIARSELMNIAEIAARLGIRGTKNITEFTRVMAMMGVATETTAEEAADALARIANQTRLPISQMENLGSVINELSNTMATSSGEIIESMRRSAPEMARFGLQAHQIAALSASLNTVSESSTRAGTRLRRLAQDLTDPRKISVFAQALQMTTEEFRKFAASDPQQAIMDIVRAFEAGGVTADNMASQLDARVRLALAALSQIADQVEHNFGVAEEQMRDATSLAQEYERFVGIITSKQVIYNNRIAENRREIGERLLPVYSAWYDLLLNIAGALNRIVDTPLEGLFDESAVQRMEEVTESFLRRAGKDAREFWAKDLTTSSLLGMTSGIDLGAKQAAKTMRSYQQDIIRDAGAFNDQLFRVFVHTLEVGTSSEELVSLWARLAGRVSHVADIISDPSAMVEMGKKLDSLVQHLEESGATVEQVDAAWRMFFINQIHQYASGVGVATNAIGALTSAQEDLYEKLVQQRREIGLEGVKSVFATEEYRQAAEARATLADKTAKVTDEQRIQLEVQARYANMVDSEVAAIESETEAYERLKRMIESANVVVVNFWRKEAIDRIETIREEAQAVRDAAEAVDTFTSRLVDDMHKEMSVEEEIAKTRREAINLIMSLPPVLTEQLTPAIIDSTNAWIAWRRNLEATTEAKELEKKLAYLRKQLDLSTIDAKMRLFDQIITGMADSTMDFFEAIVTGSGNALEAFTNMITGIVRELARAQLMQMFFKWFGPDGLDIFNFNGVLKKAQAQSSTRGLAAGGRITAGEIAVVGERGAELFVPDVSGHVISNDQARRMDGNTVIVNHNWTVHAMDSMSVRQMLAREGPFISSLTLDSIQRSRGAKRGLGIA